MTPKPRAELAARELIIAYMIDAGNHHDVIYQHEVEMFLKVIPLEQLFAVEDAIRQIGVHGHETSYNQSCPICMSLLALDNWIKEREQPQHAYTNR